MWGSTASPTVQKWAALFPEASPRHADFAKRGSVVVGDVHPAVAEVAGALTPVPGGVGPLTIALLLRNTVTAARGEGRMVRVALTGGIATGKSSVLRLLQARGWCPQPSTPMCLRVQAVRTRESRPGGRGGPRFGPGVLGARRHARPARPGRGGFLGPPGAPRPRACPPSRDLPCNRRLVRRR